MSYTETHEDAPTFTDCMWNTEERYKITCPLSLAVEMMRQATRMLGIADDAWTSTGYTAFIYLAWSAWTFMEDDRKGFFLDGIAQYGDVFNDSYL